MLWGVFGTARVTATTGNVCSKSDSALKQRIIARRKFFTLTVVRYHRCLVPLSKVNGSKTTIQCTSLQALLTQALNDRSFDSLWLDNTDPLRHNFPILHEEHGGHSYDVPRHVRRFAVE